MDRLQVFITSTRQGRAGDPIATWFLEAARAHGKFEIEAVDLQAVNLPLLDEPNHPRLRQYTQDHTKAWSAIVSRADAFVFVTPEYNFGPPPALVNALDYLFHEWAYKPAGFVSYGGVSAGTRSVQVTKQIVTTLKIVPIPEAVSIPFFFKLLANGVFDGSAQVQAAHAMLDELVRWTAALKTLRG